MASVTILFPFFICSVLSWGWIVEEGLSLKTAAVALGAHVAGAGLWYLGHWHVGRKGTFLRYGRTAWCVGPALAYAAGVAGVVYLSFT